MHDDLTKPLGLSRQDKSKGTLARNLGLLGLVMAATLFGAGTFLLLNDRAPQQVPETQTATGPGSPEAPATAVPGQSAATTDVPADASTDTSGTLQDTVEPVGQLEDVKPDGAITPAVPVPVFRRQEAGLAHMPDPALVEKGASGVIPKRGPDGERAMDVYSRPPDTEGNFGVARVVIIVGGIGISQTSSQEAIRKLPGAVTLAFAPYGNSLFRWMQDARKSGHELLLQVPMEPFDYPRNNPGPNTLLSNRDSDENLANLHWAMSRFTNYVGVMNFLGGKFVTTPKALKPVLEEFSRRGLLFVDDGTVNNSMTQGVAGQALLPYARAHIQIDTIRTRRDIETQLQKLSAEAKRTGLAIGVANAFSDSIALIAEYAKNADKDGIEITPVSAIVNDPERKGKR
ncbi:MAG: divergent polysaccharide deacetylase family protein [Nitratireductor sp.]